MNQLGCESHAFEEKGCVVNLCPRGRCRLTSLNYVQIYRDGRARELLIRRGVASTLVRVLARWEVFCSGQEAFMRAGLLLGLWNLVRQEYMNRVGRSSVLSTRRPRAILFCFVFSFGLIPWVGDFNFLKAKRRYNQR